MKSKLVLLLLFSTLITLAQGGSLDSSFNSNDIGFSNGDSFNNSIKSIIRQQDGKIILVGSFVYFNGLYKGRILRLNSDYSIDTSFNIGNGASNNVESAIIQSDGKIVIAGSFTSFNGTSKNYIARLNSNGTLDTTFNTGSGTNSYIQSVSLQSDGKIIIAGNFTLYNGLTANKIARLNSDGSLDTTFSAGTGTDSYILSTAIQSDGKILIGGNFTTYNNVLTNRITRLNTDGSIDLTFSTASKADNTVNCIKYLADGKILIGGYFTYYNGSPKNSIVRLNSNGTIDNTFNIGTGFNNSVESIYKTSDGKLLVSGSFTTYNAVTSNKIIRLNDNGSLDTTFSSNLGANTTISYVEPIGNKLLIVGNFTSYNGITRNRCGLLNEDGSLDVTKFELGTGSNDAVYKTVVQSDGKILIGGSFTAFNGVTKNRLVRVNNDGSLDTSFQIGVGFNLGMVKAIAIQNDGKILVGGYFSSYNGINKNSIIRLNSNGTIDTSFISGTGINNQVESISIQNDGKIIVAGWFTNYNGTAVSNIIRLNSNGSIDSTFSTGTGINGMVYVTTLQSNGKILVGGDFSLYNGTSANSILRLNSNGSLDTSFNVGNGTGPSNVNTSVYAIAVQGNGDIIIGGNFANFNSQSVNNVVRVSNTGITDASFTPLSGALSNGGVRSLLIDQDGKIIITGTISVGNSFLIRIQRFNNDGSIDNTFSTGSNANNIINTSAFQSDGKIIVGGAFTSYNNTGRNRVARLNNSAVLSSENNHLDANTVLIFKKDNILNITSNTKKIQSIVIFDVTGKILFSAKNINDNKLEIKNLDSNNKVLIVTINDYDSGFISKKVVY